MPTSTIASESRSAIRISFFESLFAGINPKKHGRAQDYDQLYLCIFTTDAIAPKAKYKTTYFNWPLENDDLENYILKVEQQNNVYFCVNLLKKQDRVKSNCIESRVIWADLDEINPDTLTRFPPTTSIETSPGRWQAYWRMSTALEPFLAEEYSRRMAYNVHADKSGWDLTQLMRVPHSFNFKYGMPFEVRINRISTIEVPPHFFENLSSGLEELVSSMPVPDVDSKGLESANIIYKYIPLLNKTAFNALYTQEPAEDDDWSAVLWRLLHELFKVGMSHEEVFVVARDARCNKYTRDGRPVEHLWRDVNKAGESYTDDNVIDLDGHRPVSMPHLVTKDQTTPTFIDTYREWASEATDAVPIFHDLSIFIVLSAIISSSVRLDTSAGPLTPNLWGMILGDSTLTRKTTAMRLAMDFLLALDPELILATDGTAEGLLSGLSTRPNRASIFYKDEVSGFFESMNKKDYLAGMQETLTALYDVPPIYTRRLRKETLVIQSPSFVFLCGGVTDRVFSSVNDSYVLSGFLPRFLVVDGEASVADRRSLGPPTEQGQKKRAEIFTQIANLFEAYSSDVTVTIGGQKTKLPPKFIATLTEDAWQLNAQYEKQLLDAAGESLIRDLALPTLNRMSRSLLKMAVILGAVRQQPTIDGQITITEQDVLNAAWYIQEWGESSIKLLLNAGKGLHEKLLDKIYDAIKDKPGLQRSQIMRRFALDSRDMTIALTTLEERGQIRYEKRGKATAHWIT